MDREAISSGHKLYTSELVNKVLPEITVSDELESNRKSFSKERTPRTGKPLDHHTLKVVYVGMGPNALWNALQTKAKCSDTYIEMFEKRTEYARNHTVNIDDQCFRSLNCYDNQVLKEGMNQLRNKIQSQHGHISCQEFETDLKLIAQKMGITMHTGSHYEVIAIGDGKIKYQSGEALFDALVCADGAHSKSRKALLKMADHPNDQGEEIAFSQLSSIDEDSEFQTKKDLQYRVRVKYQVQGPTRKLVSGWLIFFRYAYATFKVMLSPVEERIRKLNEQTNEVTIDFFISKKEYDSLSGYNLGHAATLSDSKVSEALKEKIKNWQVIKQQFCQETIIADTEELTPYTLSIFHARKVHHVTPSGQLICIVGDAATSLPYNRSLNNFLVVGAKLGRKLGSATRADLAITGKAYAQYAGQRARWEGFKAILKNFIINATRLYLEVSNKVCWQTNAWDPKMLKELRKKLPERETHWNHPTTVFKLDGNTG
ncbi:hypothetical protein [Endozoicomonas sp. SCSIO W0465]|uniref:hypothetical protein n=1 Tax=Endozoicomonas sp. SCSIO W0465 TaxID=2918516 RepID=UPI0020759FA3|nr:hypothetical protein [Endozoicomonas sp. SCSIO W0465]USE36723.1 hypothetical protein MJO57_00285 [Endozoicomonas sp. SCSIO W0465]